MTYLTRIVYSCILAITANFYSLHAWCGWTSSWIFAILFTAVNIRPSIFSRRLRTNKLRNCADGCELLILFLLSATFSFLYSVAGWTGSLGLGSLLADPFLWLFNTLFVFLAEAIVFWNGMIRMFLPARHQMARDRRLMRFCASRKPYRTIEDDPGRIQRSHL